MSSNWQKAYSDLKDYVSNNPQIKITQGVVAIPADYRDEFYRHFNAVREAFVKEKLPTIFNEACELSSNYNSEAEKLKTTLSLDEIKTPSVLNWLLSDPVKGLTRPVFDPLFDLLKGKLDPAGFEFQAAQAVGGFCGKSFKAGYEKWVIISLANMLSPDRALALPWDKIHEECKELQPDEKKGFFEKAVQKPEEIKTLLLGHEGQDPSFIIADLIIRSNKMNSYVSFGADLADASWTAKKVSEAKEWIKLRELGNIQKPILNWPDMVIYKGARPQDIGLVADFSRFMRPDIIVECIGLASGDKRAKLEKIKRNYDFFKPVLGSFVVNRHPLPEQALKEIFSPATAAQEDAGMEDKPLDEAEEVKRNIHFLDVGFDPSKLAPVVDALFQQKEPAAEDKNS